ncbi:PREDICTED: acid-sensing ion channel 5-like [Amphimedon queenslandica]|uniref:Uncharacterized protein n=1 Tax=Amphimedon queenslandica TaxID=400682 RepID=A0A1X7UF05_AMPQE|nr:PREDICTED: acid-sensing ion channel 5-like [Amphimedon queenslandica]|eukprot:XP_011405346.1 PREDICTED: acid-sensing ion channel 5-like [Amphimedon queenslandica]
MQPAKGYTLTDQYFHDFVETTRISGIKHIFRGRSKIRRIMWALFFISSFVGCTLVVGKNIARYIEKPTASSIKVIPHDNGMRFPSVTICNINIYKDPNVSAVSKETYSLIYYLFNSDTKEYNSTQECIDNATEYYKKHDIWSSLLPKENNFIHDCSFSYETGVISCKDMFYPVLTPAGICYTFNDFKMNEMLIPNITSGMKYGLKLVLNIEEERYPAFEGKTGAQIIVHERNDIPRPNLAGISVPPGQNIDIGFIKAIKNDKTDSRDCINDGEKKLDFLPDVVYSKFACQENELYERLASNCNCTINPYGLDVTNTSNCSLSNLCCMRQQYSKYNRNSSCKSPCKYTFYNLKNSYSSFPRGRTLTEISKTVKMNKSAIRDNFLSVHVFLLDLETKETYSHNSFDISELLGELGGTMGLFLGINILAIVEVIILILDEIKKYLCPKKCKQKLNKIENCIPECALSRGRNDTLLTDPVSTPEKENHETPYTTAVDIDN